MRVCARTRVRYMAIFRPIPIFVARFWRRKLDYAKILQAKYFTGENIPIYGTYHEVPECKCGYCEDDISQEHSIVNLGVLLHQYYESNDDKLCK